MAINFPTNAQSQLNNGDTYSDATSGITWIWDTVSWKAQGVSPSGLVSNIQDLANVTVSNLQDDQVLTYTAALGWHNESAQSGSGSGVPSIQDVTGTAIGVPAGQARELNLSLIHI